MNRSDKTNSNIAALTFDDRDAVITIWSESFYNYPAIRECFLAYAEDEQQYLDALPYLFGFFFDFHFYQKTHLLGIRCEGELVSAIACMRPEEQVWPQALHQSFNNLKETLGDECVRKIDLYEEITGNQRPSNPHYFVEIVGVLNNHQGKGYARQLLQRIQHLSAADPSSNGVFLDTEDVKNVALYQHLGYVLTGESDIEGLHSWHFFRAD
jgi:ribosomal protein S18 acetylase RimI-like enzyme